MLEISIFSKIILVIFFQVLTLRSFYFHIRKKEPDKYFALSEFLGKTTLGIYIVYIKYLVFRIFPIFIICLLNYKILPFLIEASSNQVFLTNISIVLIELLFTNLKAYRKYKGIGLAYLHLFFAFLIISSPFLAKTYFLYFPNFLPSMQGLIDNIWSAVIIYGVISLLGVFSKDHIESGESNFRIFGKDRLLLKIEKHINFIDKECEKFNADESLVKAVAIYESIQRPRMFRFLEKILFYMTKIPITQGIMQVKVNRLINDKESISLAVENYFKNTKTEYLQDYYMIEPILNKYNFSDGFKKDVFMIYDTIKD